MSVRYSARFTTSLNTDASRPLLRQWAVAPAKPVVQPPVAADATIPSVSTVSIDDIRTPVAADMDLLVKNLTNVVGDRHPMLMAAAQQIFGAGGKKLRPMLVFLVARATCWHTGR
jgi:all-trans-nonaprenyl-diphosphate synthase